MPYGDVYTVELKRQSISTAITLVQVVAGAATPFEIIRAWCSQHTSTTAAQGQISIIRKTAAATVTMATVGTQVFKKSLNSGAPALQLGTLLTGVNASGEGTDGDELYADGFYIPSGWLYLPVPEERPVVQGGGTIALKFVVAPPAVGTFTAGIVLRELG